MHLFPWPDSLVDEKVNCNTGSTTQSCRVQQIYSVPTEVPIASVLLHVQRIHNMRSPSQVEMAMGLEIVDLLRVWDVVSNTGQKYSKKSFGMPCQIELALGLPQIGVSMRVGASTGNVPLSA